LREAHEIYGVVGHYWASLLGAGRQELSWSRRAFGLAFSAVSMPFEFMPLVVAGVHKFGDARRAAAYRRDWEMSCSVGGYEPVVTKDCQTAADARIEPLR
jgi:hypothetical protein